jgi:hypothetical protein
MLWSNNLRAHLEFLFANLKATVSLISGMVNSSQEGMKQKFVVLLCVGIGIAVSWALRKSLKASMPVSSAAISAPMRDEKREEDARRRVAWRIVAPRLEIAQEEALEALKKRTQQVADFFTERQKHLPEYAERVLSLKSKWELAWSKMPKANKDGHTKFLKDEFAKIVFSEADLTKSITQATEDFVRDVNAIENALLTKVRADIQDFPQCAAILPATNTDELFRAQFAATVTQLSQNTQTDLQVGVGQLVGSEIAAVIAIQVGKAIATRLGVSAGILGTGTALGLETLGISIIAGIVVDQAVSWVVDWFYDPTAEIEGKLRPQLEGLSTLIVNGDAMTRGLVQEFTTLAEQRKIIRDGALQQMILNTQPVP